MRTIVVIVLAASLTTPVFALVQGMNTEPVKASWSGKVRPDSGVGQGLTCNFDTPIYAEFFTGTATSEQYQVQLKFPGEDGQVVAHGQAYESDDHVWVKCTLTVDRPDLITKGKLFEVRWTLAGGPDSLVYYYDSTDAYGWGQIVLPGQQAPIPDPRDLASRVYGLMDPIDSTYWGSTALLPRDYRSDTSDNALMRHEWQQKLEGKVDWGSFYIHWDTIQEVRFDSFYFAKLDTQLICMDSADVEPVPCLVRCPKWASTRFQWYDTPEADFLDTCVHCPPRGLWANPDSGDTNLWAVYLESLVNHVDTFCGDTIEGIHTWEIWNEADEGCTLSPSFTYPWPGYTGWWRRPNDSPPSYPGVTHYAHDMCSLYVRLCEVAANTIRTIDGHENDRILIGAVTHVSFVDEEKRIVTGKGWVDTCYQVATESGGPGVFWDGVSVHPYQYKKGFSEPLLEQDAADMRAVMRAHGHHEGLLWNTEIGWSRDPTDTLESGTADSVVANNAAELYATSLAALGSPEGGFDRACWWFSWEKYQKTWSLLLGRHSDSNPPLTQAKLFHAFRQGIEQLVGKRFNRRVLLGDARDDLVRILEFEDPEDNGRLWMAWAGDSLGTGSPQVAVAIPVRADRVESLDCAYEPIPPSGTALASANGWFELNLSKRPKYIIEPDTVELQRPDIVVDSVVFQPPMLTAWITNRGNRATPDDETTLHPYPTSVVFFCDDDSIGEAAYSEVIPENEQVSVSLQVNEDPPEACLFSARANPNQLYVERHGLDDNAGYFLKEGD